MKRIALTTLIAAGLAVLSAPAFAELDAATKSAAADCQKPEIAPAKGAEACTIVLDKVKMGPSNTTAIHYYRGVFYTNAKKLDQAKADFMTAIDTYEKDAAKAAWDPSFVGLVASSYAFLAEMEVEARHCDAARDDYNKAATTEREVSQREEYEKKARAVCK